VLDQELSSIVLTVAVVTFQAQASPILAKGVLEVKTKTVSQAVQLETV
jgi:hypothetical protein